MVLFLHAEEATEAHGREHDVVGQLVQHHVLDLADLLAARILHRRADDLLGANRFRVSARSGHDASFSSTQRQPNDRRMAEFLRSVWQPVVRCSSTTSRAAHVSHARTTKRVDITSAPPRATRYI